MTDTPLPAPVNTSVGLIQIIIDKLVEGFGVEAVIAAATVQAPWLKAPIISYIFRAVIEKVAAYLDMNAFKLLAKITIRAQNDSRKKEFDSHMDVIKKPGATDAEIAAAKKAIDNLVNRNRP